MIALKKVSKEYRGEKILDRVNLDIAKGDVVVIKGESGGGKSTLLNILALLLQPTSGEVLVEEENVALLSDYHSANYRKDFVGYVTQEYYLFDNLTVYENLLAPLVVQNLSLKEITKRIEEKLALAFISHKKDEQVAHLSGGEKQRVVIAKALLNNPKLLLCDEPTANLDDLNTQRFLTLLKVLQKEDVTILIVTHDKRLEDLEFVNCYYEMSHGALH